MLRIQYNDLGFIVGNRLLVLIEEQSVWTVNILIRILMYLGETYKRYVKNNNLDVYGTKKLLFPKPELYVLYPRERGNLPDEISLSKDVFGIYEQNNIFVDIKAKIIYDGKQGDIINQYVIFSRVFDEQIRAYGKTEKAVSETIRICRDKDVLKDYLKKEEVPEIMFGYLDKAQQMEYVYQEGRTEGWNEGRNEGRNEGQLQTLINLAAKKYITIEQAAEEAGMTVDDFIKIMTVA